MSKQRNHGPKKFWCATAAVAVLVPSLAFSQPTARPSASGDSDTELSSQDTRILNIARDCAAKLVKVMENWIREGQIKRERLFSYLYFPIADTDPQKYSTDYDKLSDADFPRIQEHCLSRDSDIKFAIAVDKNGYLPTHNLVYSKPLTGKRQIDLVNNRTKRIFNDRTGFAAGRNEEPYLIQTYKRDTGEFMKDLSVPMVVDGEHWGGYRIGYVPR